MFSPNIKSEQEVVSKEEETDSAFTVEGEIVVTPATGVAGVEQLDEEELELEILGEATISGISGSVELAVRPG